ncbi:3'-5' exonuclease [Cyanobacterium stanieri PCC 7202]|uniref:3'-5' exonuclease n=1 Tax=Cyanobacterium stanieri (strain ATCC 29140 / PCC 7202) TaxID=292563 RepID=K9YMG7_CYASC|nr:3'-5' exonuclease [Cyanobacterium stanieri PCC 7202]
MYLTNKDEIQDIILDLKEAEILWVDTEVADYKTKNPRLSLIQVLAYPNNVDGSRTYIFDVLNKPEITDFFIEHIMSNKGIRKVFHNAQYDLRFLGKREAKNIFCTFELAKSIPHHILPVKSKSLKKLTEYFTDFQDIDKDEQGGDWGIRPLTQNQIKYAQMDCVYLAQVYKYLSVLNDTMQEENNSLESLSQRYKELEEQWLLLNSEIEYLKDKIKQIMIEENIEKSDLFRLSRVERNTVRTNLQDLVHLVEEKENELNFSIKLTNDIKKILGQNLDYLNTEVETSVFYTLKTID